VRAGRGKVVARLATLLVLVGTEAPARAAEEMDLTGTWSADDGGTAYVRQVGTTVWWVGRSRAGWEAATNVFRGTLKGDELSGEWADTPAGRNRGAGTLTWELVRRGGKVVELRKKRQAGDVFGANTLRRRE